MSSLMAYAKSFNIPVADNITHEELAVMVAKWFKSVRVICSHFVTASVTEQTVRQHFYEKTEMVGTQWIPQSIDATKGGISISPSSRKGITQASFKKTEKGRLWKLILL